MSRSMKRMTGKIAESEPADSGRTRLGKRCLVEQQAGCADANAHQLARLALRKPTSSSRCRARPGGGVCARLAAMLE